MLPTAGLTLNQFGLDGAPLWSSVASGNDPRADLTGKNLASVLVMVPLATVSVLICASFTHGWTYLPLALGLAPGIFGVLLGVGDVVSVRVPYAMPDRRSPLAFNPGQGCASMLAGLGALAVQCVLLIPIAVVAAVLVIATPLPLATLVTLVAANAYGWLIWRTGREIAGPRRLVAPPRAPRRRLAPPSGLAPGGTCVTDPAAVRKFDASSFRGRARRGRSGRGTR